MNKMPSLKDIMLGKEPVVKENASQAFNKPLTLAGIAELVEDEYISKYADEDERIKDPDEKEMEDAEADDTLQYTGVDGDDVEEVGDHQPGAQGLEALGRSKGSAGWDPFGFDAKQNPGGGLVGGFKDLFKSKKAAPAPEGGFAGHADKMAYKDMMKMPKKQSGFGF